MKILLIDNYDSFVYNIVGLLQRCRKTYKELKWEIALNDCIPFDNLSDYDAVLLSPGPGIPSEAGKLMTLLRECHATHPTLGICLGCQAIAEFFGATLRCLTAPCHGHCSELREINKEDDVVGFYHDTAAKVGRYHSWVIDDRSIDKDSALIVTSRDEEGNIMSIRHNDLPLFGVQFHPESIISDGGEQLLLNFITLIYRLKQQCATPCDYPKIYAR